MLTLSEVAKMEKNKLFSDGAWIILIEVVINGETIRLARNTEDIVFAGNLYTAFPFRLGTISESSKGELPRVMLEVSNVGRVIEAYLQETGGAIGSMVAVKVVHSKHLGLLNAELEDLFEILDTASDAQWVTFTLGTPTNLSKRFPRDRYLNNTCRFAFGGSLCKYNNQVYKYTNNTILFVNNGEGEPGSILDSKGLLKNIFGRGAANQKIVISGAGEPGNNGMKTVALVDPQTGVVWIDKSTPLTNESPGREITIIVVCDHTLTNCESNGNQDRFGGSPGIAENYDV